MQEGPVNDGYTYGKRKLNFSTTGPSSHSHERFKF
jgi:hypothetical protein